MKGDRDRENNPKKKLVRRRVGEGTDKARESEKEEMERGRKRAIRRTWKRKSSEMKTRQKKRRYYLESKGVRGKEIGGREAEEVDGGRGEEGAE